MIAHDRRIAGNTASDRAIVSDYMETLLSDWVIVVNRERSYASLKRNHVVLFA